MKVARGSLISAPSIRAPSPSGRQSSGKTPNRASAACACWRPERRFRKLASIDIRRLGLPIHLKTELTAFRFFALPEDFQRRFFVVGRYNRCLGPWSGHQHDKPAHHIGPAARLSLSSTNARLGWAASQSGTFICRHPDRQARWWPGTGFPVAIQVPRAIRLAASGNSLSG